MATAKQLMSLSLWPRHRHTHSFFLSLSLRNALSVYLWVCDCARVSFLRVYFKLGKLGGVLTFWRSVLTNVKKMCTRRKIRTKGVWRNGCQPLYFSVLRESLLSWDGDREMEWCLHSIRVHIVFLILSIHCKQNLKELFVILWLPWTLFILLKFEDEKVYWKVQLVFLFHTNINRLWKFLFSTSCFQGRLTNCGELG